MISALDYIGIASPAAREWETFGPDVLGLEFAGRGADGEVRLRNDDAVQRLTIHPADENGVAYFGWGVGGPSGLADMVGRIQAAGFDVATGDAVLAKQRSVTALAWFTDPFGFRHELAYGLLRRPSTFRPGRAMNGFVTGDGGVGHAVIVVPDLVVADDFYTRVLGFKLSDTVEIGVSLRFYHCNARHHTVALLALPGMVGLHHIMLECVSLDDVGVALDLCHERSVPISMTLGRHTNDLMTSFYVRSPSGFEIEYGWGGLLVDDATWVVGAYDATSIWGHKPPTQLLPPGAVRPVRVAD